MAIETQDHGAARTDVITLGNLSLNLSNFRLTVEGKPVALTFHELELLRLFIEQPDRVITYQFLCESLWGESTHAAVRHLNVLVHRLRTKLPRAHPYAIETVRGRGYGLLKAHEAEASA
jgi:DNA-binding response OmpR family regulator